MTQNGRILRYVAGGAAVAIGAGSAVAMAIRLLLEAMHRSVGLAPPTEEQKKEEDQQAHALFRHLPGLAAKLAWRQLGTYPTPIHRGSCDARPTGEPTAEQRQVRWFVKREDLASASYGGNKVRTLQHQLAVCESKIASGSPQRELVIFGSGGSNQIVATLVYGLHRLRLSVYPLWGAEDAPDLDNTLNMLSSLSFPIPGCQTWGRAAGVLFKLLSTIVNDTGFLLPPGGNNPAGVLGQAAGPLELAEQIGRGELPDVDGIYVAVGSSCTISGLVIGVALARKLGLPAFKSPDFKLHAVPIHHAFSALHRFTGVYTARWGAHVPVTTRHSILRTCAALKQIGGPDVVADALELLDNHTEVHASAKLCGKYGAHSDMSRACAKLFDDTASIEPTTGDAKMAPPKPWLCGHFCAKAFAAMCDDLLKPEHAGKNMLFWQTKSLVQPRGPEDEWARVRAMPPAVKAWANKGAAESLLRPGRVDLDGGAPEDYRGLMTQL